MTEAKREFWTNRVTFLFAAVGSSVGFGNVWRFPALMFDYGGGAFLIPYLMALFFIGIPLTILEIGFGQFFQTGDIGVFGGFHPRLRGVGLSSVACGFMLDCYYVTLIAWVLNAFFDSWDTENSPWSNENDTVNVTAATDYFFGDIIGGGTVGEDGKPTRLVPRNVGFSALVWFLIFLCIGFGVKWTGRIALFTMGMPIVLLFVFLGKSLSLEGSELGIKAYIGEWDLSVLTERGDVWSVACSQIFFSIGVTFGIMTAYGSHCKRDEPATLNSVIVAISNSLFEFTAGFAVFATLGALSYQSGIPITDLPVGGFSLVFGTWPVVFNQLPGGIHWVRLIFFNLFLLGIDSAFSFQEAFLTVLQDTYFFQDTARWKLASSLCVVGFLFSLLYCTDAGLSFLDVIDFYINFVMLIVGFFEAFASGWVYGIVDQLEQFGAGAVTSYMTATFGATFLGCGLWFGLKENAVWGGFVGAILFYFAGLGVTGYFLKKKLASEPEHKGTMRTMWWDLTMGNVLQLRDRIQPTIGWVPFAWCFLIKHFVPPVLLILVVNLASSDNGYGDPQFGSYGQYPVSPYQILGILTFVFASFLFVSSLIYPPMYDGFVKPQVDDYDEFLKHSSAPGDAARRTSRQQAMISPKEDEDVASSSKFNDQEP